MVPHAWKNGGVGEVLPHHVDDSIGRVQVRFRTLVPQVVGWEVTSHENNFNILQSK